MEAVIPIIVGVLAVANMLATPAMAILLFCILRKIK